MIHTYRSNRTEALVDALADLLRVPGAGALEPEWLVVQGRAMAVWLSMELSRRLGVWADGSCLYPRNFVQGVLRRVLGDEVADEAARFSVDRMQWTIAALLPSHAEDPAFARLSRHLRGDPLRRMQLAREIADTFDRYLTYRPDVLNDWDRGGDALAGEHGEPWQPILWRAVTERMGRRHLAAIEGELHDAVARAKLPARIAIFGLSALPPSFARIIASLGRHTEVHVFSLSPSSEHWADSCDPSRRKRALAKGQDPAELLLDDGHPLLASLGGLGAETVQLMADAVQALEAPEVEHDDYREPSRATALGRLQHDVLHLAKPSDPGAPDDSVAIHSCHGPMREVEVLHDQLLALLGKRDGLRPEQVLVLLPDVEHYAPLVEAVFERQSDDPGFIPYRIVDRPLRRQSPVLEGFLRLLALAPGRMTAPEVVDLLALEAVSSRFGIGAEEVEQLSRWVLESGVRWGIDADHRGAHGQPSLPHNTWRFGLDRLLVGYALPADGKALFSGVLPYDEIEGSDAELLGKLAAFCEVLFTTARALQAEATIDEWRERLGAMAERMLASDGSGGWGHQRILRVLAWLAHAAEEAGFTEPVSLEVMRMLLEPSLDEGELERGFASGGVTFCAMVPMRTIPFEVVAMLGMSDGVFPRSQRPLELDLISRDARRPGDRSRRADDRYLFLEAILSARQKLIISYTGRSIRDDSALQPSVVVSELLEAYPVPVTQHRLQPFSPAYFDGSSPALFSHSGAYLEGARRLVSGEERHYPPVFVDRLPAPPADELATVSLAELTRFFRLPCRYLLERRLGIALRDEGIDLEEHDPLELDALASWMLGDHILDLLMDGVEPSATGDILRASGRLPPGTAGEIVHQDRLADASNLAAVIREHLRGAAPTSRLIDARLPDGTTLTGEIGDLYPQGIVRHQYSRVTARSLLALWIAHLAHGFTSSNPTPSVLIGKRGAEVVVVHLNPVSDPAAELTNLVDIYREGLCWPLPFVPTASCELVKTSLAAAKREWSRAAEYEPLLGRLFGDCPLADEGADELARRVFEPLLAAMEEAEP